MVQNVVIRGKTAGGVEKPALVDANGQLVTSTTIDTSAIATSANQTNGTQVTKTIKNPTVSTIINNATFSATVTGSDIDLTNYSNLIITYKTGTRTGTATMDISFQVKDSVGNYITHTSLTQVASATSGYEEIYGLAHRTGRIVCTFGGTDNFATTTVEVTMSN